MNRALVIAAHPDDDILGCGATISKYLRRNVEFMILFVAEGSSCRFDDPNCSESSSAISTRACYALDALSLLGVNKYHFADYPCGRLDQVPIIEINKTIERTINQFQPDTIFTHSGNDVNNDHRILFRSTIMATRPGSCTSVKRVLAFEVLSSSEWSFGESFMPTWFEEIHEEDLKLKWRALSAYKSEISEYPYPRSEQGLRILAMNRGMQAGVPLAEAFSLVREVKS